MVPPAPLFAYHRPHRHSPGPRETGIMWRGTRRQFLGATAAGLAAGPSLLAQAPGDRPSQDRSVKVINPRGRVPISFIIDDSTCLVNLNRFAIPQFDAAWGEKSQ